MLGRNEMLSVESKQIHKLFSWGRYLYWAEIQRKKFIDYDTEHQPAKGAKAEWRLFAVASQWLASMWVVIEGWRDLGMKDETIDRLLTDWPNYCDLLRRYRNGVFHYQPTLLDERFDAFQKEGPDFGIWVFAVYLEFQRFLWHWPDRFSASKEQKQEMRKTLENVIGWMPEEIIPAYNRSLQEMCEEALTRVQTAGDTESEAAKDLLSCVSDTQNMLRNSSTNPLLDYDNSLKKKTSQDGEFSQTSTEGG
jgi:hypothetical protein